MDLQFQEGHIPNHMTELKTVRMPCLVNGFLGNCNRKPNVTSSVCQIIPRSFSCGISPDDRSWYFTPFLLFSSGILSKTYFLLLVNFVKFNPPVALIAITLSIIDVASLTILTNLSKSST